MPTLASIKPGDKLPEREFRPDIVQSFFYNAVLFNAHRIHFDTPYATGVEGYPGLVLAGPQMGDWLTQCVIEWLGDDGVLASIEYSNRQAAYIDDVVWSAGEVTAVDTDTGEVTIDVCIRNEAGDRITPGVAIARLKRS